MKNGGPTVRWIGLAVILAILIGSGWKPRPASANGFSPFGQKLSADVLERAHSNARDSFVPLIVQFNEKPGAGFDDAVSKTGSVKQSFANLNTKVIEVPARAAEALAARPEVRFISLHQSSIPMG